jgi:DNA-binding MarR family transcriptional regulator
VSVKVSTYVYESSLTTGNARLILLAIADEVGHNGYGFISQSTIAKKVKCSPKTVQRIIKNLCASGELELMKPGDGRRKAEYQVHMNTGEQAAARQRYFQKNELITQDVVS